MSENPKKLDDTASEPTPNSEPTRGKVTKRLLESLGIRVVPPSGKGFVIGVGKVHKPKKD
jgi:hypothetical protein